MRRSGLAHLASWKDKANRKPLVIRGARQVGKSYLVRLFAAEQKFDLCEINLELQDDYRNCFSSKNPHTIISLIELKSGKKIQPGKTLLFLDEIQAAPEVLAALRYFYELIPRLHIIGAGSLLEFVLEDHSFSMPVGRIEYMHLGPMTFKEFLDGVGRSAQREFIGSFDLAEEMPTVLHDELLSQFKKYLVVGGMPEAVQVYSDTGSLLEVDAVKQSILLTYRDDFSKYRKKVNHIRLQKVFQKLPGTVGKKLKYVSIDRAEKSSEIKKALHLLSLARIYYPVRHTAANGIPLGAEANEKFQKPLFLDVGLLNKACGLSFIDIDEAEDITLVNAGAVCEQFVGQHLLFFGEPCDEPELYYWTREKRQASSEVDYLLSIGTSIIPVEVKSGKTGTLKSLNVFLQEKNLDFALRFNADLPSYHPADFSLPGVSGLFHLLSLPLYLVEETKRLVKMAVCL